jgi:two-component system response regulator HydG
MMQSEMKKNSILIVDDSPENLTVLRQLLTENGYRVRPALNGETALTSVKNDPPDLILLDIMMPDMNGYEVCRRLKSNDQFSGIPIIFISALGEIDDKLKGFSLGGVDYIIKPFQAEEVLARVRTHLSLKNALREKESSNMLLEGIFSSFPDAIITVDKNAQVISSNTDLDTICNTSDICSGSFKENLQKGTGPCFQVLSESLKTKKPVKEYQIKCGKDKNEKIFVLNTSPLTDPKGKFMGTVMVMRDITRLTELEKNLKEKHSFRNIIGKSKEMQGVYSLLEKIADIDINVLIFGESGTGKELIADALHHESVRAGNPLIKVNCAALSENLLESELFGHVKGAFTGAISDKIGRIQAAEGGTIVLDEIGDIHESVQVKLLRFLEQKEYERVGESKTLKADVRVLAATNRDLKEKMSTGEFREDLFYRLKGMIVQLPPLRERKEDIPLLCRHFMHQFQHTLNKNIHGFTDAAMKLLLDYPWPGNIRELRHSIEHACILCSGGQILPEHLPAEISINIHDELHTDDSNNPDFIYSPKLDKEMLQKTLQKNQWNKVKAARDLGISRSTLYKYLTAFNISPKT